VKNKTPECAVRTNEISMNDTNLHNRVGRGRRDERRHERREMSVFAQQKREMARNATATEVLEEKTGSTTK
jgi:hypothetical protein